MLSPHSDLELTTLPEFSGSHMIRDPRDILLSAYYYHLRTDEEWCAQPNPHHISLPPDVSYQQHLQSLSLEDGILYELSNVSGRIIEMMGAWDYDDPRFLELRFEDVINNEKASFERIFSWHGFSDEALETIVNVADARSLARLPSSDSDAKHARPGGSRGQWRDVFTPKIKQVFKEKYGDVLIRLGYATDDSW